MHKLAQSIALTVATGSVLSAWNPGADRVKKQTQRASSRLLDISSSTEKGEFDPVKNFSAFFPNKITQRELAEFTRIVNMKRISFVALMSKIKDWTLPVKGLAKLWEEFGNEIMPFIDIKKAEKNPELFRQALHACIQDFTASAMPFLLDENEDTGEEGAQEDEIPAPPPSPALTLYIEKDIEKIPEADQKTYVLRLIGNTKKALLNKDITIEKKEILNQILENLELKLFFLDRRRDERMAYEEIKKG